MQTRGKTQVFLHCSWSTVRFHRFHVLASLVHLPMWRQLNCSTLSVSKEMMSLRSLLVISKHFHPLTVLEKALLCNCWLLLVPLHAERYPVLQMEGHSSRQLRFWMETMSKIFVTANGSIWQPCGRCWWGCGMLVGDPGCQLGRALLWRMQLPARVSFAHTVTLLMMLQSHVSEGLMQPLDANFWSQLKDL